MLAYTYNSTPNSGSPVAQTRIRSSTSFHAFSLTPCNDKKGNINSEIHVFNARTSKKILTGEPILSNSNSDSVPHSLSTSFTFLILFYPKLPEGSSSWLG